MSVPRELSPIFSSDSSQYASSSSDSSLPALLCSRRIIAASAAAQPTRSIPPHGIILCHDRVGRNSLSEKLQTRLITCTLTHHRNPVQHNGFPLTSHQSLHVRNVMINLGWSCMCKRGHQCVPLNDTLVPETASPPLWNIR